MSSDIFQQNCVRMIKLGIHMINRFEDTNDTITLIKHRNCNEGMRFEL